MTIDPAKINAYPWNPKGKLCPFLDDPALWAEALADDERRAVKTAAKRLGRREVISITNDQKIGELCCWLLGKSHYRKVLAKILVREGRPFVHQALWREFYLGNDELRAKLPIETFTSKDDDRFFLDTEAFRRHLDELKPDNAHLRAMVILGSAFAMLQPDTAQEILKILLDYDQRLESQLLLFLAAEDVSSETPSSPVQDASSTPNSERDEEPEPQGLVTDAPKVERALQITRAWIQGGQRISDAYINVHASLMKMVESLSQAVASIDLAKANPLEEETTQVAKVAMDVSDAAAETDSWLDEWLTPLQVTLTSAPDEIRDGLARLFTGFRAPRSSAAEVMDVCQTMRGALADLSETYTKATSTLQGMQQKVASIREDIGKVVPSIEDSSIPDDLVKIATLNVRFLEEEDRLGAERAALVSSRRLSCQSKSEAMDTASRVKDAQFCERFDGLQKQLQIASTLADLTTIESEIQALSENWPRLVPKRSIPEIAADALEKNGEPAVVVQLAEELVAVGRNPEAALLLELVQAVFQPEAADVDFHKFTSLLLTSWSSQERVFPRSWASHALFGRWIAGMTTRDVRDFKMRRRFSGAFLAVHAFSSSEALMGVFYKLGLNECEFGKQTLALRRLYRDIIEQQPFVISDGNLEKRIDEATTTIFEFFHQQGNGEYIHQVAHGNEVAEAERQSLFPGLRRLSNSIIQKIQHRDWESANHVSSAIEEQAREAFTKHGLSTTENSFYQKKIFGPTGYLTGLHQRIQRLLSASKAFDEAFPCDSQPVLLANCQSELAALAQEDALFAGFWSSVQSALELFSASYSETAPQPARGIEALLDAVPAVMLAAPELVVRWSKQEEPLSLCLANLTAILENLRNCDAIVNFNRIKEERCLVHAVTIAESRTHGDVARCVDEVKEALCDYKSRLISRCDALTARSGATAESERAREAIFRGKLPLAELLIQTIENGLDESAVRSKNESRDALRGLRDRVMTCQHAIEEHESEAGADRLIELCGAASAHISSLVRNARQDSTTRVKQLTEAIEFAVRNKSTTFSEIESLLGLSAPRPTSGEEPPSDSSSGTWGDAALQAAWDFLAKQRKLNDGLRRECNKRWGEFVRSFCRLSEMYHDLNGTLVPSPLAGCYFGRYKSEFYSPRSAWLDRPVHLYLLLRTDDWEDQWSRLSAHINDEEDARSIVVVPECLVQLKERFGIGKPEDPFVLIGREEAQRVSGASVPGAPLRQLLHRGAAKLTDIGLFCTDGVVHSRKNLFVGRESALQKLQTEKASAVWGGRRIGKTSLLHALKERLGSARRRDSFNVGYVYADPLHGDPDFTLAARITESLGLRRPEDVASLASILTETCKMKRVAVLIDEVDRYIEASRNTHGPSAFPLARILRGVSSQNPDTFKVVYAGFKQLYFEVNIRPNPDNAYPFKNFLTPLREDFGDLNSDKVEQLLRMAFEDMLGISLDPGVARLVKEKTSGHPAFVQEFGRQLLEIIERRRRATRELRITLADVEKVYAESPDGTGGHSSYIDYVYETLGWNLSQLGKAVMLAISNDIVANGYRSSHVYELKGIPGILANWASEDAFSPNEEDFANTLKFLVMTNMLLRHLDGNSEAYSVAYPSYIDFMVKLGDKDRIRVHESLVNYREHEIGKIV
jgi:hypothetical protein